MPKFYCTCGYIFNLSKSPLEEEFLLVPETAVEDILCEEELSCEKTVKKIDDTSRSILLCPECSKLWLQETIDGDTYTSYTKDKNSEN